MTHEKNRFIANQIIAILKEADAGMLIAELTRKYGLGKRSGTLNMQAWKGQSVERLKFYK